MIDKIYRLPVVMAVTGLCRSSLYNALATNDFPEPVRLGKRAIGWREGDLSAWVASRQKRIIAKS